MSVIVSKRQPQKYDSLTKAIILARYTVTICMNEKNFPKKFRWILTKDKVQSGQLTVQNAADSFLGWAAHAERKQAHSNRLKRRQGHRAWKGYNAKYIEKMRDYFIELYKIDPYNI